MDKRHYVPAGKVRLVEALAYKSGTLNIKELRKLAEQSSAPASKSAFRDEMLG
ncbi:MAG: hypothetical protein ABR499_15585 [Gemmatimonadaceae bacterium]